MNIDELRLELENRDVPALAYSIRGDANEAYCLTLEVDGWHVYYSERGNRNLESVFATESMACEELLRRVLNDGTVRREMEGR